GRGDSGGGNDFTLLRLRNAPPVTALQAGYSTAIPDLNAPVVALHHPRGEWMRISFGAISNVNNVYAQDYHEVVWNDGTTEPGSSGSPLFLAGTAQIIGQLWGGGASCAALLAPDYYGRFDVTFPGVKNFIGPR